MLRPLQQRPKPSAAKEVLIGPVIPCHPHLKLDAIGTQVLHKRLPHQLRGRLKLSSLCNIYLAYTKGGPSLKMQVSLFIIIYLFIYFFGGVEMVIGWICSCHLFKTILGRLDMKYCLPIVNVDSTLTSRREQNVFVIMLSLALFIPLNCSYHIRTCMLDAGDHA